MHDDLEEIIKKHMMDSFLATTMNVNFEKIIMSKKFTAGEDNHTVFSGELPYTLTFEGYSNREVKVMLVQTLGTQKQPVISGRYYLHPDDVIYFRSAADRTMFVLKWA